MSTTYTFKACDGVTGIPTAFIPHFSGAQVSVEFSDVGSIGFSYLKSGINYSALEAAFSGPVEIAVFQNGVEIDDGRFRIQSADDDEIQPGESVGFVGVSLAERLDHAITYSADGSLTQGIDQVFTGTPGGILKALFDQNAARGTGRVMDQITYASFSATLDSAGNAWAFTLADITYTVGVSYLDILRNMVNNGMIEFKMVGRDLRIYNAGTMGVDKTIIADPIVLRKGRDLTEAPRTRTNEQIAAVALIAGDDGKLKQITNSSVGAAWGYDETFISQGGISDDTTLGILAQEEIDRRSQVRVQNTHKIALHNSPWVPYVDYRVSDYIFTDRGNGPERLRIRQMVLEIEPGGVQSASIVLNDKFLEREIAIARRVDGILGGATSTGSVAIPVGPDPAVDTTTPNTPASLTNSSAVYVNENGRSVSAVALSWPASTLNTDGSTLSDLDHYETEWRAADQLSVVSPSAFAPAREEEDYTRRFDRRWKDYGWIAGENGVSVRADGTARDFWLFGNSAVGTARGQGDAYSPSVALHNSGVITDPVAPTTFISLYGRGNKLSANDAFLESGLGNWQADTNCSVSRSTLVGWYVTSSLQITATAAGDATAKIATPPTSNYSVVEGRTYSAMAKVRTASGTARNVQIGLRWFNSSNALISTSLLASSAGLTGNWVRYTVTDVAPVGAVKVAMTIVIKSAAAAQVFNADTMGIMEGDMTSASWNDPNRGLAGGPIDLVCPEDMGGSQIAAGSLATTRFRSDTAFKVSSSSKIYGMMYRVNSSGVFQNITAIAQWDSTTLAFQDITSFTNSDTVQWGTAHHVASGFIYLYGKDTSDPDAAMDIPLMRVPDSNPLGGTREWISNATTGTWTTTRASAVAVQVGVNYWFSCITFSGGVYNLLITPKGSKTVRRLTATNLYGPFTDTGIIYSIPLVGGTLVAHSPRFNTQFNNNIGINMMYSVGGQGYLADVRKMAPKWMLGPMSPQAALTPIAQYSAPRIIESGVLTDNIGNLIPGWNFQARVRAVDSNGHYSIWTESTPIRLVDDTTPPNKPSLPIISPMFKGVRVEWDGQDYQGGPMPTDWARTEVHLSNVADFLPGNQTLVDTFTTVRGGVSPISDLEYGDTYYTRFVAVDIRGNRSDPSDVSSTTTEQLVNVADIAKKLITGANIADGTIATNQLTVAAFEPSIILNGSFEDEATDASGNGTGLPYGWALHWPIGAGNTVTLDTTTPIAGAKSLQMVQATAADGARWESVIFPVTEGKLLAASVKVRANRAIANPAFEMHIVCGATPGDTGAFPSANSIWGTSVQALGTTTVQTLELQRVVDAGMKYARVFITALNSADGSGWTATFDGVEVRPVGGSAFIADASILNAKIANLAVDNAKIANVNVGKLTAGSLVADITLSARIKTANTGARVELNSSGLQAYNSSGVLTVDIAAASGNATFTGTMRTDFPTSTNPHLEIINSGDRTTIFFTDASGTGANYAFINSPADIAGVPRIGINSGEFNYLGVAAKHRLFLNNNDGISLETYSLSTGLTVGFSLHLDDFDMTIQRISSASNVTGGQLFLGETEFWIKRIGGNVYNGGGIYASTNDLYLETQASGVQKSLILLSDNEAIQVKGRFSEANALSGKSALFVGSFFATTSAAWNVGFGATMATQPYPLFSLLRSTAPGVSPGAVWASVASTTDFTVTSSGTAANTTMVYWVFRKI